MKAFKNSKAVNDVICWRETAKFKIATFILSHIVNYLLQLRPVKFTFGNKTMVVIGHKIEKKIITINSASILP